MVADEVVQGFLDGPVFDGQAENTVFLVTSPKADHVLAVEGLADGEVRPLGDPGMQVLDVVPEAPGESVSGGASHDDACAFWVLEPV